MPLEAQTLGLWPAVGLFLGCALAILLAGTRLTRLAETTAERTGLGQAVIGAALLGAVTSLPGIVTSVYAAWLGRTDLAIANALGGIAAQTAFLAVADLFHRRANLEHAAASLANLAQGVLLLVMLSIPLLAYAAPPFAILWLSPFSVVLVTAYVLGLRQANAVREQPMWRPTLTHETQDEAEEADEPRPLGIGHWLLLGGLAAVTALAGFLLTQSAIAISTATGVSETAVGALMTAVVTSLPELVTTVAAVRQNALNLAVGGIIGGNAFDVLFLAFADLAYRDGPIYAAFTTQHVYLSALGTLMTAILLLGLLARERHGIAGIGFEGALLLALYLGSVVLIAS